MNEPDLKDGPTPTDFELRFTLASELRAESDAARKVTGYAALFGVKTKIRMWGGYSFEEWLNRGAFSSSLKSGRDVRYLAEHRYDLLLSRVSAGTLTLLEDDKGLRFDADLPDTTAGRDTYEQIRNGNYSGMSFGFKTVKNRAEYDDRGRLVRIQHDEVDLGEISVTSMPAYPKTSVAIRSLATRPAPDLRALRLRVLKLKG